MVDIWTIATLILAIAIIILTKKQFSLKELIDYSSHVVGHVKDLYEEIKHLQKKREEGTWDEEEWLRILQKVEHLYSDLKELGLLDLLKEKKK